MLCFRILADREKDRELLAAIRLANSGVVLASTFLVSTNALKKVPGSPFAYWVSDNVRRLFGALSAFEGDGRTVKQGLVTSDDFRFVRASWEVRPADRGKRWVPFAKGGSYSPFYADVSVLVNWYKAI
jgi:hypothetical protein